MPRLSLAVLLLASACSPKSTASLDAGAKVSELVPGVLGSLEPDAPKPGSHPVDLALGDAQRPCALFSSGEVWCWRLDAGEMLPGRVPGTWDEPIVRIRADKGRLLMIGRGKSLLFQGAETHASVARRRTWFRNAPVALGTDVPIGWQCRDGASGCLVGSTRAFRWVDETSATSVRALPTPTLCAGVAPELVFAPEHAEQPWLVRCGAQSLLLAAFGGSADAAPTLVSRPIAGLPAGSRIVGWHGDGRAEVQRKDGTLGAYVASASPAFTQAEWSDGAAQKFVAAHADVSPASSLQAPSCTLDGSEVLCAPSVAPSVAARARKLAATFLAAPRQLWTSAAAVCAWGAVLEGSWAVRCMGPHDELPRDVAF